MRNYRVSIAVLVIAISAVIAQTGHSTDFQTWSDITTIKQLGKNWRYDGEQGIRGILSQSDFTLLYFRPSVGYQFKPWCAIHGGIRFASTFFDNADDTFEIGPWQGIRFTWPMIGKYAIGHYIRLEERFVWKTTGDREQEFSLRSRYRLGFKSPNYEVLLRNGIFLTGSIELFWNLDASLTDNFVDRLRYEIGIGSNVTDALRIQLHYLRQDSQAIDERFFKPFVSKVNILRLRFYYTFD